MVELWIAGQVRDRARVVLSMKQKEGEGGAAVAHLLCQSNLKLRRAAHGVSFLHTRMLRTGSSEMVKVSRGARAVCLGQRPSAGTT